MSYDKTWTFFLFIFHKLLLSYGKIIYESTIISVFCRVRTFQPVQYRGNAWDTSCMFKIMEVNSNRDWDGKKEYCILCVTVINNEQCYRMMQCLRRVLAAVLALWLEHCSCSSPGSPAPTRHAGNIRSGSSCHAQRWLHHQRYVG